jgi:ABC-2 type transport system permease protein
MIVAVFAPFDARPYGSAWAWPDLPVMAIWGVAGAYVALRRFRFEPRPNT